MTNISISEKITNQGLSNQKNEYSISGKVENNKFTKISTIKIDADEGMHFTKIPFLVINDERISNDFQLDRNIKLKLIASTSNTSYTFDLMYKSNKTLSKLDLPKVHIKFNQVTTPSKTLEITNVKVGKSTLNKNGETRNISIYGKPNTPFNIVLNSVDENKDSDGNVTNYTESSILSIGGASITEETTESTLQLIRLIDDTDIDVVSKTIDSSGVYSFKQSFPSTKVKATAINGSEAAGGATKIIFDDLTYVRVGDQVVMKEITSGFITVTELNPDGDNENECSVSASITAADNALVTFKRSKKYRIYVEPGTDATIDTSGSISNWVYGSYGYPSYYSKTLNQYLDPVLTLRASTDSRLYSINAQAIPGSGAQQHDSTYIGQANVLHNRINGRPGIPTGRFTLTYLLDAEGSKVFSYVDTIEPAPRFSNLIEFESTSLTPDVDWTSTLPDTNGGTRIDMSNITISAAGANTITITAKVDIIKWGYSNVVMELNLDNIVSVS